MAFSQGRTTYFPCIKEENRQTQPQLYGPAYLFVRITPIGQLRTLAHLQNQRAWAEVTQGIVMLLSAKIL